jgi:RimJ/RimL family protein N-acetyltransferase
MNQGFRLYLRELKASDVNENYLEWFNDNAVLKFLEVKKGQLTTESVIEYIENGRETKSYFMYAICTVEGDKHIGNIKVGPINYQHMTSDLVAVIGDTSQWGKGYGVEAIKLGNKLAFEKYNIRKLSGGIYSGNKGSVKAYTQAGWIIEGTLQNHFMNGHKYADKILVSCFNPAYVSQ